MPHYGGESPFGGLDKQCNALEMRTDLRWNQYVRVQGFLSDSIFCS